MEDLLPIIFFLFVIVGPIISRILKAVSKGKGGEAKSLDDRLEEAIERAKARQSHHGRRPSPSPPLVTHGSARSHPQSEHPHLRKGRMPQPSARPPRPAPVSQARPSRPAPPRPAPPPVRPAPPRPPVRAPERPSDESPYQVPHREARPAHSAPAATAQPDAEMQALLRGMRQLQNRQKKERRPSPYGRVKTGRTRKKSESRGGIATTLAEARKMVIYKEIMSPPKGRRGMPPLPGA